MMSAFPTATFKCHNDTETFLYDVVTDASREAMEPVNGFVRCTPDLPTRLTARAQLLTARAPVRARLVIASHVR